MDERLKDYQFIYHDDQNKTRETVKQFLAQGFEIFGTAIVMKRKEPVQETKKPKIFVINKPLPDEKKGENDGT